MSKKCSRCGGNMRLMLRSVVYRNRVKIRNVPVHVCMSEDCTNSQVVEAIKEDLKKLMNDLGQSPIRQVIGFDEVSEFSQILVSVADQTEEVDVTRLMEQRINDLLDLFLLAQSLGDQQWMHDIRNRLTKLYGNV
ncbi:hypothetical protein ACI7RC_20095 [Brevibacillus sp. B_LB10_24]|uniref:hypothetical protein n=1 Tax=Brevibacillus sp. B_LB10_24 TaxID=3380645 RepID=UPI0038BCA215